MNLVLSIKNVNETEWIDRLQALLPDRKVEGWNGGDCEAQSAEYLLAWKPDPAIFAALPNLKVIFSLGAGVDHLTSLPELPQLPLVRIVDPDLTSRMTEWVVFQTLLHHRQHLTYAAQQEAGVWNSHKQCAAKDVRVGILGLGELGLDSAKALKLLGFQIAGWSRRPKLVEGLESFAGNDQLESFLNQTDILINLLPATPSTHKLIDAKRLAMLSQTGALGGPVYINAGRGATQDEEAIDAALTSGLLKGASIDVFAVEPLSHSSPLWKQRNCIITPHVAADSNAQALSEYVAGQIKRFEQGEALQNLVDLETGY
ncbi:Glyoxylate/hydroxypyruvate reductase A [Pseudovibrio axinellae]|uniref:Glyoxylate/hydroxypyruvate reductase A n=1 Tax=Pseudovibrio axinellae TaxID=989403 RepID=A0A166B7X6_9HYPH|nr:glyoxylate/hydroxypyruvate reductase A [Pseudovibrio axinellae]KZL21997.1 Glyoxylate/hydroxypyruvate reductase A [Pseudovibrio axinellae]SEQ59369.1 glyoxylate/hydroxypyruvate reductase A [Pseudovibrio axinellae]